MKIESFRTDDIAPFLTLAATESWVAAPWEFEFLLSTFPQGCFAARWDNGETAGFVTSLRHERSGWIGNLIVAEQSRGRGIGEALFRKTMEALRGAGVETIWLTASESGAPLYEKHGFTGVDKITRWVGTGRQRHLLQCEPNEHDGLAHTAHDLDTEAWGDRRAALLDTTAHRGMAFQNEGGFIVRQPCGDAVQIGPFCAADDSAAERLFEDAFGSVAFGTKVLVDAPASNCAALGLFNRRGMRIVGTNELMCAGVKPDYRPEYVYGLATMGSCG